MCVGWPTTLVVRLKYLNNYWLDCQITFPARTGCWIDLTEQQKCSVFKLVNHISQQVCQRPPTRGHYVDYI